MHEPKYKNYKKNQTTKNLWDLEKWEVVVESV